MTVDSPGTSHQGSVSRPRPDVDSPLGSSNAEGQPTVRVVDDLHQMMQGVPSPMAADCAARPRQAPVSSSRNSPEPHQTNRDGHYIGPSSGVSFLIRAQKRLQETGNLTPTSSIFTFGDSPLPAYDSSFFVLPSKQEAQRLLATYFDFAVPTFRFLHRQTTERWLDDFYAGLHDSDVAVGSRERNALILMIMAQAKLYTKTSSADKLENIRCSAIFFGASEHQLCKETGEVRLTSVQARLAQCFYLLSQSRINHCWSLFGTTARLALAIGLHRKRRRDGQNIIETECRKRVFWCAYSLDNYLSAALGRPRVFHDDDLDQDLPSCVDDADLAAGNSRPGMSKVQSIMLAPVYHARLSRIISGILKDLYGIGRLTNNTRALRIQDYDSQLRQWRNGIAGFLDAETSNVSLLMPPFSRQWSVLNMAYGHAAILLHRPFLLSNFANLARPANAGNDLLEGVIRKSADKCVEAAMDIVRITIELCENGQMFGSFWVNTINKNGE